MPCYVKTWPACISKQKQSVGIGFVLLGYLRTCLYSMARHDKNLHDNYTIFNVYIISWDVHVILNAQQLDSYCRTSTHPMKQFRYLLVFMNSFSRGGVYFLVQVFSYFILEKNVLFLFCGPLFQGFTVVYIFQGFPDLPICDLGYFGHDNFLYFSHWSGCNQIVLFPLTYCHKHGLWLDWIPVSFIPCFVLLARKTSK